MDLAQRLRQWADPAHLPMRTRERLVDVDDLTQACDLQPALVFARHEREELHEPVERTLSAEWPWDVWTVVLLAPS